MPNQQIRASAITLPNTNTHEPAFAITDAGRMYLLLQTIIDRLDVEGSKASFELTPEIADELAAFGAEAEDLEDDDPTEEDTPPEVSEQLHTDCRLEPYNPVELKPTRRIRRGKARFLFEMGDRVVIEIGVAETIEVVGTIKARSETEDGAKYIVQPEGLPEARIEVEARRVYPAIAA